jgi:hypothetical protein
VIHGQTVLPRHFSGPATGLGKSLGPRKAPGLVLEIRTRCKRLQTVSATAHPGSLSAMSSDPIRMGERTMPPNRSAARSSPRIALAWIKFAPKGPCAHAIQRCERKPADRAIPQPRLESVEQEVGVPNLLGCRLSSHPAHLQPLEWPRSVPVTRAATWRPTLARG